MFHLNPWNIVLIPIGLAMLYLGYSGWKVNRKAWANIAYFALTIDVFLWILFDVLASLTVGLYWGQNLGVLDWHHPLAIMSELKFIFIAPVGAMFLYFTLEFIGMVNRAKRKFIIGFLGAMVAVDIILLLYTIIAGVPGMHKYIAFDGRYLNNDEHDWLFNYYHTPMSYALLLLSYMVLIYKMAKPEYKIQRMQAFLIFLGSFVAVAANFIVITINPMEGAEDSVDLTLIGFAGTVMAYAYAMFRYSMFKVMPKYEETEEGEPRLQAGEVYVASDQGEGYAEFTYEVRHGRAGLIFTVKEIDAVREEYGLRETPIFRLASELGKDTLNPEMPEHMEMIPFIISDFLDEADNGIIYLDGVDTAMDTAAYSMLLSIVAGYVREEKKHTVIVYPAKGEEDLSEVIGEYIELE